MELQIDYDMMEQICLAPISDFEAYATKYTTPDGIYYYKDNGSRILAVAHLDSVNPDRHFYHITIRGSTIVYNAQLDDRLGAYIILELLPKLGLNYDILLTEGEEIGKSTAKNFVPPTGKNYNWMFQFDRHGDDVVTYKYTDEALKKKLRKCGFNKWEYGAFTDICELGGLGCKGFNVGCGYHDEHSPWAWADITGQLLGQLVKFVRFYTKYQNVPMEHKSYTYTTYGGNAYSPHRFQGDEWDYQKQLPSPQKEQEEDEITKYETGEVCMTCMRPLVDGVDQTVFAGVCALCEDTINICGNCGNIYMPNITLDKATEHLCLVCVNAYRIDHISRLSKMGCGNCKVKLLTHEIILNHCMKCGAPPLFKNWIEIKPSWAR